MPATSPPPPLAATARLRRRPPYARPGPRSCTDILGPHRADRVLADPAWPALVAAVTTAARADWTPATGTHRRRSLAPLSRPPTAGVTDDDLADALIWRIAALTDPNHSTVDAPSTPTDADPSHPTT